MRRTLDILGWIGTAVVVAAAAVALVPKLERFAAYSKPMAIAGLVLVLAYTIGQWREIGGMFSRRQARYGTLSAFSVAVVLGILVAINYIGAKQNKRWDLTTNQVFSLSEQTRNILAKLDAPLQVQVFAKSPDFPQYRDRIMEYEHASKRISTEYIDPDAKPIVARQAQATPPLTILMNYKGRSERVTSDTEQDITTAIIKVVQGRTPKVYFTQGHGERDTASQARDVGYSGIAAGIKRENYDLDKLILAQAGAVPADASVIVVAGPKTDFLPNEIEALKKYLDEKAGKLLLEIDPPEKADSPQPEGLIALAHDWGIEVGNNIVIDPVSRVGNAAVPVAANYPPHAITQNFGLLSAFYLARSAAPISGGVNGRTAQPVVETSRQSWGESDIKGLMANQEPDLDEKKGDKPGPVSIAAAVSAAASNAPAPASPDGPKPETRIVVIGDSDFASNGYLGLQGDRDLFMNILGWLSQQENLIAIRPREPDDRRITLTANQQTAIYWLSLLIVPGAVFGTGVYTWWRKR